eukprot:12253169-Alexandrium_andersonii.AAC.1
MKYPVVVWAKNHEFKANQGGFAARSLACFGAQRRGRDLRARRAFGSAADLARCSESAVESSHRPSVAMLSQSPTE